MNDIVINTNQFNLELQEQVYDLTIQQNTFELQAVADNEYQLKVIQQPYNLQITENAFQLGLETIQFKILELTPVVLNAYKTNVIDEIYIAGEIIGGHKIVMQSSDGKVYLADPLVSANIGMIIGMSTHAAVQDAGINIRRGGILTNPGWGLTPGAKCFATANGGITVTKPSTGFSQIVLRAIDANNAEIIIFEPYRLN